MSTFFESIKDYVGFDEEDSRVLAALLPSAEPGFAGFADHFYACITEHPEAHTVLTGPDQVERLKETLVDWMRSALSGPHGHEYFERRCRIGRIHVRIGLPQRYMFTAMNVIRLDFRHLIQRVLADDALRERRTHDAIDKLFDLELAIMLHTYREDSEERLRRHERLATIGQIAASIGHDLRNPLSVIQSSMYILRKRAGDDERVVRHLDRIGAQVELCESIISNLLELARNQPPRRERLQFDEIYRQVVDGLDVPAHIVTRINVQPRVELWADRNLLRQAIVNLIDNAIKALGKKPGAICVSLRGDRDDAIIEVADDGPGFEVDTITRVFEPLVSTRTTGTGLGLALVKGVTERHGGTVLALNRPEGGAVVQLRLPQGG